MQQDGRRKHYDVLLVSRNEEGAINKRNVWSDPYFPEVDNTHDSVWGIYNKKRERGKGETENWK